LKFFGLQVGDKFAYRYDFGDDWLHEVLVEQILEPVPKETYPKLIVEERACPPENCGGPPGYEYLLEVLQNPKDPEYKDLRKWTDRTLVNHHVALGLVGYVCRQERTNDRKTP